VRGALGLTDAPCIGTLYRHPRMLRMSPAGCLTSAHVAGKSSSALRSGRAPVGILRRCHCWIAAMLQLCGNDKPYLSLQVSCRQQVE